MRDGRKNDLYMSWSSDGELSASGTGLHVINGASSYNDSPDIVMPVSPSEAPSGSAQGDFYTYSKDDDDQTTVKELDKKSNPWKWVIILLLLAALGVGLYLWLVNRVADTMEDSGITAAPTNENLDIPSTTPTTSPDTKMPSLAPTAPRIFDPPSAEDCIAIARGETLEGQDELMVERYEVVLDVAFDSGGLAIEGILNRLAAEIRQVILPEILGCGDADRHLMEIESASSDIISMIRGGAKRKLNPLLSSSSSPSSRYIMANADVSVRNPSGEWCASGSGPLCYRIIVSFDMAFRSDGLKVLSVIEFIAQAFKTSDSLINKLLLGPPFQNIFIRDVYPAVHTAIPTMSPSY